MTAATRREGAREPWLRPRCRFGVVLTLVIQQAASACDTPSNIIPGGCSLSTDLPDVEIHYQLLGSPPTQVDMAVRAPTTGYVAISFRPSSSSFMSPADAVIGQAPDDGSPGTVQAYQINSNNGPTLDTPGSINLTATSAQQDKGFTTIRFTRDLAAGRYPIDPSDVRYNLALGPTDAISRHYSTDVASANLTVGIALSNSNDSPYDKYWVAHGTLAILAWALIVPNAIAFATHKVKWIELSGRDSLWFQAHRALQLVAAVLHVAALLVALTEFNDTSSSSVRGWHAAAAWGVTVILGVQIAVALFLRPAKGALSRRAWAVSHLLTGLGLFALAIAAIGMGIYLYHGNTQQSSSSIMSTGRWVGFLLGVLLVAAVHFVALSVLRALRPSVGPPEVRQSRKLRTGFSHLEDVPVGDVGLEMGSGRGAADLAAS